MDHFNGIHKYRRKSLKNKGKFWREDINKHNVDLRGMEVKSYKQPYHIDLRGIKTKRQVQIEEKKKHYEENFEPIQANTFIAIPQQNKQIDLLNQIPQNEIQNIGVENPDQLEDYKESISYHYGKVDYNKKPDIRLVNTPEKNIIKTHPNRNHPYLARSNNNFYNINQSFIKIEKKISNNKFQNTDTKKLSQIIRKKTKFRKIKRNIRIFVTSIFLMSLGFFILIGLQDYRQQGYFLEQAIAGYYNIENGKDAIMALDSEQAEIYFTNALNYFEKIENNTGITTDIVLSFNEEILINKKLSSYKNLLESGKLYSKSGIEGSKALNIIKKLKDDNESDSSQSILLALEHIKTSQRYFSEANDYLIYIDTDDIPEEFKDKFSQTYSDVLKLEKILKDSQFLMPIIIDLLGYNREKTYLFLLQNTSELRPTGGFIGTYGLLPVYFGKIEPIKVNGIYDPDGQIKEKIIPPKPLQYVTPNWETRDSNWFLDFSLSAQKAIDFLIKSGEVYKADGVIAVNPELILKLLNITGPIEMEKYNLTITEENFLEVIQEEVELNYDKELNEPKKILSDLTPIILERVIQSENYTELLDILMSSLNNKDIMFYSTNPKAQEVLEKNGFAGKINHPQEQDNVLNDYLAVAFANLGGGKTDAYTKNYIDTKTTVKIDGSIIRDINIRRQHNGGETGYAWYDKDNYGYVKIYVPKGSEIISAEGFANEPEYIQTDYKNEKYQKDSDIELIENTLIKHTNSNTDVFEESGMTVFGNWYHIKAGQETNLTIQYRLPIESIVSKDTYKLNISKSSGVKVDYSGDFRSYNSTHIFNNCRVNDESISLSNFQFKQEQDSIISCSLVT